MRWPFERLSASLIPFLLCGLMACGPCALPSEPGLKVVVPAMPTTLDWNDSDPTSWVNYPVMLATQRGLTTLAPDATVQPGLAERWEQTRDAEGRERYTFHLRRDVRWSTGAPLVARDFVVGWRRALVGKERGELGDFAGAEALFARLASGASQAEIDRALDGLGFSAVDDHTLAVTLAHPRSYFLARLANVYPFFPAPSADLEGLEGEAIRDYFDRPREGRPAALGPYRVERWDRAGERVRLVLNPTSAFLPALQEGEARPPVVTLMRSEIGPALYARGRVDFVFVDSAAALAGRLPADLQRRELLSTYFLAFNTEKPPLDRPEVRRALAQALDREALLKGLLPSPRPTHLLLPPELPDAAPEERAHRLPRFEPEVARARLREVGPMRPLRLVHRAGDSFLPEVAIAERIASQLARFGVEVHVEARSDFSAEIARRGPDGARVHDFYLRRLGADYAHPNTFFTLFKREGNHQTGWERAEGGKAMERFEDVLRRADQEEDRARARELYADAQALLLDEQAVVAPLYHPDRYFRVRPGVRGLDVDPLNFLALRALRVKKP